MFGAGWLDAPRNIRVSHRLISVLKSTPSMWPAKVEWHEMPRALTRSVDHIAITLTLRCLRAFDPDIAPCTHAQIVGVPC